MDNDINNKQAEQAGIPPHEEKHHTMLIIASGIMLLLIGAAAYIFVAISRPDGGADQGAEQAGSEKNSSVVALAMRSKDLDKIEQKLRELDVLTADAEWAEMEREFNQ